MAMMIPTSAYHRCPMTLSAQAWSTTRVLFGFKGAPACFHKCIAKEVTLTWNDWRCLYWWVGSTSCDVVPLRRMRFLMTFTWTMVLAKFSKFFSRYRAVADEVPIRTINRRRLATIDLDYPYVITVIVFRTSLSYDLALYSRFCRIILRWHLQITPT